jgi:hypothetical protein
VNRWYKLRTADHYIVSYPKCGRTWLRVLLSNYYIERYGLQPGSLLDFANLHYQQRAIPKICFTHHIRHTAIRAEDISTRIPGVFRDKPVFLVRDPRDVIVSLYFQRTRRDTNYTGSLVDFIYNETGGLATLVRYYNVWARYLPEARDYLLLRYEDLRVRTSDELTRLLEHLGHEPDPGIVRNAVAASSFERMKKRERNGDYSRSWLKAGDSSDEESFKVRRGKIGGYEDYLDDVETDRINRLVRETLTPVFGYTDGADTGPRTDLRIREGLSESPPLQVGS